MTIPSVLLAIRGEFARLELDMTTAPNLALDIEAADEFLLTLRRLEPGVSWSVVFPEASSGIASGAYVPLGPFDYQEPTTAPAVTLVWPIGTSDEQLPALVGRAIQAGWPVYGAGFYEVDEPNPDFQHRIALLVFTQETSDSVFDGFMDWIATQSTVRFGGVVRRHAPPFPDFDNAV